MTQTAHKPPTPSCLAIILCEETYKLEGCNNLVIANTFHGITCGSLPGVFPKITVLFTLTNGHGHYDIELSISEAATENVIRRFTAEVTADNPLQIADRIVSLRGVQFQSPGKHWVELRANGELISQRPFMVSAFKRPDEP
ncbi:MAG TPA: hypothetical protein VN541_09685 [Tepidisphaeraceae bacterium]|nr:hypothetical protein [Tepidisphaeraceae bacterium]